MPKPPLRYTPDAPATITAFNVRRVGSRTSDMTNTNTHAPIAGPNTSMTVMDRSYGLRDNAPVAEKTMFVGITPRVGRRGRRPRKHLVAVVAFDGVVLGDLATPC